MENKIVAYFQGLGNGLILAAALMYCFGGDCVKSPECENCECKDCECKMCKCDPCDCKTCPGK